MSINFLCLTYGMHLHSWCSRSRSTVNTYDDDDDDYYAACTLQSLHRHNDHTVGELLTWPGPPPAWRWTPTCVRKSSADVQDSQPRSQPAPDAACSALCACTDTQLHTQCWLAARLLTVFNTLCVNCWLPYTTPSIVQWTANTDIGNTEDQCLLTTRSHT